MPEFRFHQTATRGGTLALSVYLLGYWIVFAVSLLGVDGSPAEIERCFWSILLHTVGIGLQIGADVQKTTTLQLQDGLITTGFFERTRNPNYLGELFVCFSIGMLSKSYLCWCYLIICWILVFGTGILKKEASLMQKEGYKEYKETSLILLPRLFPDKIKNYKVYGAIMAVILIIYIYGGFFKIFGIRTPRKIYELF